MPREYKKCRIFSMLAVIAVPFLALGALFAPTAVAVNKECERILGQSAMIKFFRKKHETTRTGTWFNVKGRMVFVPNKTPQKTIEEERRNFAAHAEILRRQIGENKFDEILSSSSTPEEAFEKEIAREQRDQTQDEFDLEAIHADVSQYGADDDLPQELEDKIVSALKHFERLATPLSDWLRPKVVEKRLGQLPNTSFTDGITKMISPTTRVHKANLVTVRLNGVKQFIISSSYYSSPDSYHRSSMEFLKLLLPRERLLRKETPGYIVIKAWDETFLSGQIQFVIKGSLEPIFRESYDFAPN